MPTGSSVGWDFCGYGLELTFLTALVNERHGERRAEECKQTVLLVWYLIIAERGQDSLWTTISFLVVGNMNV